MSNFTSQMDVGMHPGGKPHRPTPSQDCYPCYDQGTQQHFMQQQTSAQRPNMSNFSPFGYEPHNGFVYHTPIGLSLQNNLQMGGTPLQQYQPISSDAIASWPQSYTSPPITYPPFGHPATFQNPKPFIPSSKSSSKKKGGSTSALQIIDPKTHKEVDIHAEKVSDSTSQDSVISDFKSNIAMLSKEEVVVDKIDDVNIPCEVDSSVSIDKNYGECEPKTVSAITESVSYAEPVVNAEPDIRTESLISVKQESDLEPVVNVQSEVHLEPVVNVKPATNLGLITNVEPVNNVKATVNVEPVDNVKATVNVEPVDNVKATVNVEPVLNDAPVFSVESVPNAEQTVIQKSKTLEATTESSHVGSPEDENIILEDKSVGVIQKEGVQTTEVIKAPDCIVEKSQIDVNSGERDGVPDKVDCSKRKSSVGSNEELEEGEIVDDENELNLKYPEGVWRPDFVDGRKQYPVDFLMTFLKVVFPKPTCTEGLPVDLFPSKNNLKEILSGEIRLPIVNRSSAVRGGRSMNRSYIDRQSERKNFGGNTQQPRVITQPLMNDVVLRQAENAWVPKRNRDLSETDLFSGKLVAILNKITADTKTDLINEYIQICSDEIGDSLEKMKICGQLLYQKALDEPNYNIIYTELSEMLSRLDIVVMVGEKKNTIHRTLIWNCQETFEKFLNTDLERDQKIIDLQKKIDDAKMNSADEDEIARLNAELYENESIMNARIRGLITFIGQLFNREVLGIKVVVDCLDKLISNRGHSRKVYMFVLLLLTVGEKLDAGATASKAKSYLNNYMKQAQDILQGRTEDGKYVIDNKTRFFLEDLFLVRKNKWIQKWTNEAAGGPKTKKEVHDAAKREMVAKEMETNIYRQRNSMHGSKSNSMSGRHSDDHFKPARYNSRVANKPKIEHGTLMSSIRIDDTVRLGPGGAGSRTHDASAERRNYMSRPQRNSSSASVTNRESENRFNLLDSGCNIDTDNDSGNFRKPSIRSRNSDFERAGYRQTGRTSSTMPRGGSFGLRRSGTDSGRPVQRDKPIMLNENPPISDILKRGSVKYDESRLSSTVLPFMKEYSYNKNLSVSMCYFYEAHADCHPAIMQSFFSFLIEDTIERCKQFSRICAYALKHRYILAKSVDAGFAAAISDIASVWCDLSPTQAAEKLVILSSSCCLFESNAVSFEKVCTTLLQAKTEFGFDDAYLIVTSIVANFCKEVGVDKAADIWKQVNHEFSSFYPSSLSPEKRIDFQYKNYDCAFLFKDAAIIKEENTIKKLLSDNHPEDEIIQAMKKNMENKYKCREMVRCLVRELFSLAYEKNSDKILDRYDDVLLRFIGNEEETELCVIREVQCLIHRLESPPGLLRQWFYWLFNKKIVSKEAFISWSDTPEENAGQGHGIALNAVTSFIQELTPSILRHT